MEKPSSPHPDNLPKYSNKLNSEQSNQPPSNSGWREAPKEKIIKEEIQLVYLPKQIEHFTYSLIHLVGYSFLGYAIFQLIDILIPLRFNNSSWEFLTQGKLVEQFASTAFLSLLFIFFRNEGSIRKIELQLLKFLSWSCLALGIFYFLMIPLGIINTGRILEQNEARVNNQLSQTKSQISENRTKFQATPDEQIEQFLSNLKSKNSNIQTMNPASFRKQMLQQATEQEKLIEQQAQDTISSHKTDLIKNSVKWNIGAVLAGIAFILAWRLTVWARAT